MDIVEKTNILSAATSIAVIRAEKIGIGLQEEISIVFTLAAGKNEYHGRTFYNKIKSSIPSSVLGLSEGSIYGAYETDVRTALLPYISNEQERIKAAVLLHAIIYGCSLYPSLDERGIYEIVSSVINNGSSRLGFLNPFTSYQGELVHPFTLQFINSFMSAHPYSTVMQAIAESPENEEVEIVNYNWYETSGIFSSSPDLQRMMDSENQYYFMSGKLIYSSTPSLPECQEMTYEVNGEYRTGYLETPCFNKSSYIGPVSGTEFYREFNDGPYSSGDFNSGVKNAYLDFDKSVLSKSQYNGNSQTLYSFSTGASGAFLKLCLEPVFTGGYGEYNLTKEYENSPADYACVGDYQSMHVGDNRPRSIVVGCNQYDSEGVCIDPVCEVSNVTGFKFALIQVNPTLHAERLEGTISNPKISTSEIAKNSLNYDAMPYFAEQSGSGYLAQKVEYIGMVRTPYWYFGPPQFSGRSELPFLAFYQDFSSNVSGSKASFVAFAAVGSGNNRFCTGESDRAFLISENPILSGTDLATYNLNADENTLPFVPIFQTITSTGVQIDGITNKLFAMGDGLRGMNASSTREQNAGFFYDTYESGVGSGKISAIWAKTNWSSYILGNQLSSISYISGYSGATEGKLEMKRIFAQSPEGDYREYYYMDNNDLPLGLQVVENEWAEFSPLPSPLESATGLVRLTGTSKLENNLPRYSQGPAATYEVPVLYPNAKTATELYGTENGFAHGLDFSLDIREESVREIFAEFTIENGVKSDPSNVPPLRPTSTTAYVSASNEIFGDQSIDNDVSLFDINGSFTSYSGVNLVDNEWSVEASGSAYFSGRNGRTYDETFTSGAPFFQGILLTGRDYGQARLSQVIYSGGSAIAFDVIDKPGIGIFHNYSGFRVTGRLDYKKPIYSLLTESMDNSYLTGLHYTFRNDSCNLSGNGMIGLNFDTLIDSRKTLGALGMDPIFFEYIGGRSGQYASGEGGWHSQGVIGDSWMFFDARAYGSFTHDTPYDVNCNCFKHRIPEVDDHLILISSSPNETSIYTRAMQYYPFLLPYQNPADFSESDIIASSAPATLTFEPSIQAISMDLGEIFPVVPRIYPADDNETTYRPYSSSGFSLGPFDRDIEVFAYTGEISGYFDLFLNNVQITDGLNIANWEADGNCIRPFYPTGYTFFLVPKDSSLNINVSCNNFGDNSLTDMGFPSGNKIYIRAKKTVGDRRVAANGTQIRNNVLFPLQFTEGGARDAFITSDNGLEQKFTIAHSGGFENLVGLKSKYVSSSRTGDWYPKPDADRMLSYSTTDADGNLISPTVEEYWIRYTRENPSLVTCYKYREGSRIAFEFNELTKSYGDFPYDRLNVLVATGSCVISGGMGYLRQADSGTFSEGFYMEDESPNRGVMEEIFVPSFRSDIINRGFLPQFSGDAIHPVLSAPSKLVQRVGTRISKNQTYIPLLKSAPENYNKFKWPAYSDLRMLNPEETIEAIPPDDGNTYLNEQMIISASQGQSLANGDKNPDARKIFVVKNQFQMYDSVATDASINTGYFVTSGLGASPILTQPSKGILCPKGTTLNDVGAGLVDSF